MSTAYGKNFPFDQQVKNCHGLGGMPRVHLGMWKISTLMRPSLIRRYIKGRSSGHSTGSGNSHHQCSGNIFAFQANVASSNLVWCFKDTSAIVSCIGCPSSVGSTPTHRIAVVAQWQKRGYKCVLFLWRGSPIGRGNRHATASSEVRSSLTSRTIKIYKVWVRIPFSLPFLKIFSRLKEKRVITLPFYY